MQERLDFLERTGLDHLDSVIQPNLICGRVHWSLVEGCLGSLGHSRSCGRA